MKNFIVLIFMFVATLQVAKGQTDGAPIGFWSTARGKAIVEIYKSGDKLFGKIVWLTNPKDENGNMQTDIKNTDVTKQTRPILGLNTLIDLEKIESGIWDNGYIYSPEHGKKYNCRLTVKDDGTLEVRGYKGIPLFGESFIWKRVKKIP